MGQKVFRLSPSKIVHRERPVFREAQTNFREREGLQDPPGTGISMSLMPDVSSVKKGLFGVGRTTWTST